MTPDLFTYERYPAVPGYKSRDTAREAAESIKPKASTLRARVLSELARYPMTADECATALRQPVLSIRPRFSELAALGKIEDTGERRFNASGKRAAVWRRA